ncbi:alpha/beta fold hydrolase [Lysinibacillus sp. ZYM-1]|uniref:alpha/beta fold hydrolase n=1 Tax=Lysinibacillus sp. ZYM-1 TaxID=1681184 RepID=UPI0006CE7ABF|nr:alpha/beta hydrolase [Lysinibacillus sp. ZYM-1]KPN97268.1 2-hydroxy-6-oxo-6-phenylhexa-2,4-dienoate hydrolase [Lysinibacillus sp. ZYM-1]
MPFCQTSKANIYFEIVGTGIPIIMLHGFSPDHRLMKGCMEPIFLEREGWKRIYFDLPGMGKTTDYSSIQNSDEMLEAVSEFIHTIIPHESYLLVGESYGGYLARGIMRTSTDRLLGAAFICPLIIPEKEQRTVPEHCIVKSDANFLSTLSQQEQEDFQSHQVVLDAYNWMRYTTEVLAGCCIADQAFLEKIQHSYGFSFAVDERSFDKPSLFLLGKQDSVVGYQDAFAILEKFPRASFAILDMAGHNLQIEQPELFTKLMIEWLERVEGDKGRINTND